jgi:DNA-binding MarR family transcriptional regulator
MSRSAARPGSGRKDAAPAGPDGNTRAPERRRADDDNWDQRLGFLMHDVSRLRRSVFDEFVKPLGVTRSQWWVLAYLSRHDGMIQSDLAAMLDLGRAALGGLIDRLESSGLLERRADAQDRRAKRVYLSAAGHRIVKEMRVHSHAMSERILEGLDRQDRLVLADLLSRVKGNLLALRAEAADAGGALDAAGDPGD